MFKLTDSGDLEKAGKSIGAFFAKQAAELEKSHSFHTAMAGHHAAMATEHGNLNKAHGEHAELHKAAAEGLDNTHELKAHHAKAAEIETKKAAHHGELEKLHKAAADTHGGHAENFKTQLDAMKTMASDWGGSAEPVKKAAGSRSVAEIVGDGGGLDERLTAVTDLMMTKAIESLDNNPAIGEAIERIVLDQIQKRIGGKIVPDNVTATHPGFRMVPRTGQREPIQGNGTKVDLALEEFVKVDDE